jgi:hypothetical protein
MTTLELTNSTSVIDFNEVANATHKSIKELVAFGTRQRSTNVTVKGAEYDGVFSTKGFTVTIETTATAIANDRFRSYLMAISGQGFTYRSSTVGTVQTIHFTSDHTDQQLKEYVAQTFFEDCETLRTELAMEIANLVNKINGFTITPIDTTDLRNLDHQISQKEHAHRYLSQTSEKLSDLNDLIKVLPKSPKALLNGRYRWGNFWKAVANVSRQCDVKEIQDSAQWCLSNLINPKNPYLK